MSSDLRDRIRRVAVGLCSGVAAAVALGALNQAAHPGGWAAKLAWALGGLLAAGLAVLLAGRRTESSAP